MKDSDTRLVIKRTFQAPVEKVYKAWTTPSLMRSGGLGPPLARF
jgi:uncharacterized protein YndB with AHSA1/START domain